MMLDPMEYLDVNFGRGGQKPGELAEVVIENLVDEFVLRDSIAIDCGVADGRFLKLMLDRVGSNGKVIGFEPIPESMLNLEMKFKLDNCELIQACVSNKPSKNVEFYWAKNRRWVSSLSPDNLDQYEVEKLIVPVTTVDDVVNNYTDVISVSFIKLDIEGAEFNAMRGGESTILTHHPVIVFENSLAEAAKSFKYNVDEFFSYFEDMGYVLFDVFGIPLTKEKWNSVGKDISWNFIAIHSRDERLNKFKDDRDARLQKSLRVLLSS